MDDINVSILTVISHYCFAKCYRWGKLNKVLCGLFLMTACKLTIMSITFRLKNINEKIKSQQESEQSI